MDMEQELEWKKAQNTVVNVDLVAAAKRQLKFLAAVDRNRWLYSEGPALNMAIYRYKVYWLPLLAKHSESPLFEGPLVVPLDCEWVWHCHRLNPVRYKSDCEELYGIILDNHNVVSTVEGASKTKTEEIWKNLYPDMPYELNLTKVISNAAVSDDVSGGEKYTKYDLLAAVKRQSSFFYQVARQHMSNELYLEGAVARYKAFLHLIKINRERSIKSFSVPTYDVDLMWHTHQLHPTSYCKDLVEIMGKVLEHDDTDSDRTEGKKLDVGFSGTTKQWEEIYGVRYWRAGAMHRGNAPLPLRTTPYLSLDLTKKDSLFKENQKIAPLSEVKVVEVMLEFVDVKNQPEEHKGSLFVSFRKTQPDTIFNAKRNLTILSQSGEKQVACFQCQPTGHLLFELMCNSASNFPISKPVKTMGSGSVSLEDLLSPLSKLTMEKWLEFVPSSKSGSSKPFYLRVALSITVPTNGPRVLHLIRSRPYSKNSCFFPLPGRVHLAKSWTRVIDDNGNEIISLQMRESKKPNERNDPMVRKEVIGITKSGGTNRFAEFTGREWLLIDSNWSVKIPGTVNEYGHLVEMIGDRSVKFFPGRKLEYEPKHCKKQRNDHDFLTAVEFSAEDPYGKALALFDFKTGTIKINEEWLLFPGLILAFILGEMLRKEGYISINSSDKNLEESECLDKEVSHCQMEDSKTLPTTEQESRKLDRKVSAITMVEGRKCNGGCGGGCGSACGNEVNSGACGGCGANCVNVLKSGSCGGCGGGCGSMVKSGGCGGCGGCGAGCGGGCGNMIKSGGCGGCGGGCGGGGCGGGCGNKIRGEGSMDAGACGGCGGSGGCGGHSGNQLVDTCKASKDCITEQKEILVA